jgi:hypothetical protein
MLFYLEGFCESMESHANLVTSWKFLGLNYATVKTSKLVNLYELGEGVP